MKQNELETIWIGAFRYYLGRQSYAVSDFCSAFTDNYRSVPDSVKCLMLRELKEAYTKDEDQRESTSPILFKHLGADCDRAEWVKVLTRLNEADDVCR